MLLAPKVETQQSWQPFFTPAMKAVKITGILIVSGVSLGDHVEEDRCRRDERKREHRNRGHLVQRIVSGRAGGLASEG